MTATRFSKAVNDYYGPEASIGLITRECAEKMKQKPRKLQRRLEKVAMSKRILVLEKPSEAGYPTCFFVEYAGKELMGYYTSDNKFKVISEWTGEYKHDHEGAKKIWKQASFEIDLHN